MLAYNFMKYEHENFHFLIKKKNSPFFLPPIMSSI